MQSYLIKINGINNYATIYFNFVHYSEILGKACESISSYRYNSFKSITINSISLIKIIIYVIDSDID